MGDQNTESFGEQMLYEEKKDPLRLSVLTEERAENLERIRGLDWLGRVFRRMEKGSLRGVVIMWVRLTLGVGVLILPYYMSVYGYLTGTIALIAAGLLNLDSFYNIWEASQHFKEKTYLGLVEKSLGPVIYNIFKVTFFLDQSSFFLTMIIVSWNLFEYSLYFTGYTNKDWFIKEDQMIFNESNPVVSETRGIFIFVLFAISIPIFLKRTLHNMQKITIGILFVLIVLLFFMVSQTPFFYSANKDSPRIPFQPFRPYWIECFFSLLLSFYVQPYVFSLREELVIPTQARLKKVALITVLFEIGLFVSVGLAGYMSLGETYMTDFFLKRKSYDGESQIVEHIYQGLIIIFFLFNSFGIAIFNPTMRDYLHQIFKLTESKASYAVFSLVPFALFCLVAYLVPSIVDVFNLLGLTICNFNGYIIPALMRIKVLESQGGSRVRVVLLRLLVATLSTLCFLGLYFRIF